jgi:hypothetical protein
MAVAGLGEAEAVGGGMARWRRSAAAWRGGGGRRRATLAPTTTRTTTSGTHQRPPSPPRQPRPRGAPTDALLPHLGDHDHEEHPPTPSFPTSTTMRTSGSHRRPPSPPRRPRGRAASSLRRILNVDLGGGRTNFFSKIDFSYRSVPTDTINGLFFVSYKWYWFL